MLPDAACVEPAGNFLAKCERLVHIPGGHGQDAIEMLALDPARPANRLYPYGLLRQQSGAPGQAGKDKNVTRAAGTRENEGNPCRSLCKI